MISGDDQRRLDEIARQLRTSDPDFAARMANSEPRRAGRVLTAAGVLLWATVPAIAYAGGWFAVVLSATLLTVAGALVLMPRLSKAAR
ncbi:DUF3040 domain-containing protein [Actinomycetes bacterium KLBMP 9797]